MTRSVYRQKALHDLYAATTPAEFRNLLSRLTSAAPWWHPSVMLREGQLRGLVLGGSIPLGIGSAASDIDLIVVLDKPESVPQAFPAGDDVISANHSGAGTENAYANLVLVEKSIEFDMIFISQAWLQVMHQHSAQPGTWLNQFDLRLLSMVKNGWALQGSPEFSAFHEALRRDHVLVTKATVSKFIYSLKALEDAWAAASEDPILALHLGRSSVEWSIQGYFASQGILHLGEKWMRLAKAKDLPGIDKLPAELFSRSQRLMFPSFSEDRTEAVKYLHEVACLTGDVKAHIERDARFKAGFALSAQVGEPSEVLQAPLA